MQYSPRPDLYFFSSHNQIKVKLLKRYLQNPAANGRQHETSNGYTVWKREREKRPNLVGKKSNDSKKNKLR